MTTVEGETNGSGNKSGASDPALIALNDAVATEVLRGSRAAPRRATARGEGVPFLGHPSVLLFGLVVSLSVPLRWLFFRESFWLWSFAGQLELEKITPWARWAMGDRDGAEPYSLMIIVGLLTVATTLGIWALNRLGAILQATISFAMLVASADFALRLPPVPPVSSVASSNTSLLVIVCGSLLAAFLLQSAMRRDRGIPKGLMLVLLPLCFTTIALPSIDDLVSILAPALRLQHGFAPAQVYMQYDLLPSLLVLAWHALGATSETFTFVVSATFYAMFLGLFVLGRRLFSRPQLAAPMLVCTVLVRYYGVFIDANATPQVTPMRLELWVPLLAVALVTGLRCWRVGLTLACLFFFSRSVGTLYLGAYALALTVDFFANRHALPPSYRRPFVEDVVRCVRESYVSLCLIGASILLVRLVFGSFGSDAVALYRQLGVGMMRIDSGSFYWWLLPMTGALAWLAFSRRGSLPTRRGQAAIFAGTLLLANSSYFFGRSHEHNLVNLGSTFLFSVFLTLDLAWPWAKRTAVTWLFALAPWGLVTTCAYYYSGRVLEKVTAQAAQVLHERTLSPALSSDFEPLVDCSEIDRAVHGPNLFFFAKNDYWFYERCSYVPPGYMQPLGLAVLKQDVVTELNVLLAKGYAIVIPQQAGEWAVYFNEFLPQLGELTVVETRHYRFYRRTSQG